MAGTSTAAKPLSIPTRSSMDFGQAMSIPIPNATPKKGDRRVSWKDTSVTFRSSISSVHSIPVSEVGSEGSPDSTASSVLSRYCIQSAASLAEADKLPRKGSAAEVDRRTGEPSHFEGGFGGSRRQKGWPTEITDLDTSVQDDDVSRRSSSRLGPDSATQRKSVSRASLKSSGTRGSTVSLTLSDSDSSNAEDGESSCKQYRKPRASRSSRSSQKSSASERTSNFSELSRNSSLFAISSPTSERGSIEDSSPFEDAQHATAENHRVEAEDLCRGVGLTPVIAVEAELPVLPVCENKCNIDSVVLDSSFRVDALARMGVPLLRTATPAFKRDTYERKPHKVAIGGRLPTWSGNVPLPRGVPEIVAWRRVWSMKEAAAQHAKLKLQHETLVRLSEAEVAEKRKALRRATEQLVSAHLDDSTMADLSKDVQAAEDALEEAQDHAVIFAKFTSAQLSKSQQEAQSFKEALADAGDADGDPGWVGRFRYCSDLGWEPQCTRFCEILLERRSWRPYPRATPSKATEFGYPSRPGRCKGYRPMSQAIVDFADDPLHALTAMLVQGRHWIEQKHKLADVFSDAEWLPSTYIISEGAWQGEAPIENDAQAVCWFLKPSYLEANRGVQILASAAACVDRAAAMKQGDVHVVQPHIEEPMLLGNRKFHLKLLMCPIARAAEEDSTAVWEIWVAKEGYIYEAKDAWNPSQPTAENQVTMIHSKPASYWPGFLQTRPKCCAIIATVLKRLVQRRLLRAVMGRTTFEVFSADFIIDQSWKAWLLGFDSGALLRGRNSSACHNGCDGYRLDDTSVIRDLLSLAVPESSEDSLLLRLKHSEQCGSWEFITCFEEPPAQQEIWNVTLPSDAVAAWRMDTVAAWRSSHVDNFGASAGYSSVENDIQSSQTSPVSEDRQQNEEARPTKEERKPRIVFAAMEVLEFREDKRAQPMEGGNDESDDDDDQDDAEEDVEDLPPPPRRIGPRQSVSAEAYGAWNKVKRAELPIFPKSEVQRARLQKVLSLSFLFSGLEETELEVVLDAFEERDFDDTRIIQEGDDGDCLYIVEEGKLECRKVIDGEDKVVKVCAAGDVFGELALLYNCPRAASVDSVGESLCWRLDRQTFNQIVKESASQRTARYDKFVQSVSLFSSMEQSERARIVDCLKIARYRGGEVVVRQGESGDRFFIVEEGELVAAKASAGEAEKDVKKYSSGEYFGELALLKNQPRAATIRVISEKAKLVWMDRKTFTKMLGPLQGILERSAASYT